MQTPLRPTIFGQGVQSTGYDTGAQCRLQSTERASKSPADPIRRLQQREKQLSFGYATEGYHNMVKLVEHDPLLKSGGVIPFSPPDVNGGSKRIWDVSLRKWRRALHMFDYVFIDGMDEGKKTLEGVVEEQRLQWVSDTFSAKDKKNRVKVSANTILKARSSPHICSKLYVEDCLKIILRGERCYEPVDSILSVSNHPYLKGGELSPADAGIKMFVAPSPQGQFKQTPVRSGAVCSKGAPRCLNFDTFTPVQNKFSENAGCEAKYVPASGPPLPQESRNIWATPSIWIDDGAFGAAFGSINQTPLFEQVGSVVHPSPSWNLFVAPPAYTETPQQTVAPGVISDTFTPVTAPRRLTLLKDSNQCAVGSDMDALKRNLFPNTVVSQSPNVSLGKVFSLGPPSNLFYGNGGE